MLLHLSVCPQGGGVCLSAYWDLPLGPDHPLPEQVPPRTRTPGAGPLGTRHPRNQNPQVTDIPLASDPPETSTPRSRHPPGTRPFPEQAPPGHQTPPEAGPREQTPPQNQTPRSRLPPGTRHPSPTDGYGCGR